MAKEQSARKWPVQEWRRLQNSARPTLKELLLAETPRAEIPIPPR
jgi:antitoxin Phd